MNQSARVRALLDRDEENGAVAVYVALILVVLMIVAAFAIDLSRWYVELQRLQGAADAGALAAAPLLHDEGKAEEEARTTVGLNGYSKLSATPSSVTPAGPKTRMRVTVEGAVTNAFASLFGFTTTTLHRSATAEYVEVPCDEPSSEIQLLMLDDEAGDDCAAREPVMHARLVE